MGNGQPAAPQGIPSSATITCECGERVLVRIPHPLVISARTLSAILFAHEVPDACPKCGSMFIMKLAGIGPNYEVLIQFAKLQSQQSVIVPGDDQTLRNTLALNQMANKIKEN